MRIRCCDPPLHGTSNSAINAREDENGPSIGTLQPGGGFMCRAEVMSDADVFFDPQEFDQNTMPIVSSNIRVHK